jgi:hypothetical protein
MKIYLIPGKIFIQAKTLKKSKSKHLKKAQLKISPNPEIENPTITV